MTPNEVRSLIKEEVSKALLEEALTNLEHLHDGVSTSTMVGKPWFHLISALESVIDETKDFREMYSPKLHGPLPNTQGAMINLQMIVKLLTAIKPVIMGMDDIQRKDV